jgi:predicted TIM-barrel fold metal-dependent hydrolase
MFDSLRRWSHDKLAKGEVPVEWTLEMMDEAGVRCGMLCAWWGPAGPLIPNDEVAALVERHPDRFVGIASVDLHRPMQAVRELRWCVREPGFRGLRIVPWLWNLPPDDRRYYPAVRRMLRSRHPLLSSGRAHRPTVPLQIQAARSRIWITSRSSSPS